MYNNDDEKRKQEMLQRVMQNNQQYNTQEQQRKQEMYTRIMNNEPSPTARRTKVVQNSTPITTRIRQKMQQIYMENKDKVPTATTSQNRTNTLSTYQKIDMTNLTTEQRKKLEEIQKQTSQNKIQLNTNPDNSNQVLKTIGNTGRKISDTFGINNLIKNSKEIAKSLPEAMKETSTVSPALMGIRSSIAGMADAGATEAASLFEERDKEDENIVKYLPIVGNMYRGYKTGEKVIHKAQEIANNGGNAGDVIWGAGSTLATEQFNNIKQNIPTYAVMDKIKQGIQDTNVKNIDAETRRNIQNNLLNITSDYNEDLRKYQENESHKGSKMQFVDRAVEGTTRMLPTIALSVISGDPSFGLAAMGVSAKGSATKEAMQNGTTLNQAVKIGDMKATVEVLTELATSGISAMGIGKKVLGPGFTDNIVQKLVLDKIKNKGLKMGASVTLDVLGEIAEEIVADVAGSVIDRGTYKEDAKLPTSKELWQTAKDTTATTLLLNTITGGFIQNYRDINNQQSVNQMKQALEEAKNNTVNEQQTTQNQDSLKGKSFEDIVDEAMSNYQYEEVKSPLQNRNIETIGKEKVNAYQYDNPEVKPYFQEMAQMLGEDIGNVASKDNRSTIKGGGTSLNTNIAAVKQLHEMGYSYNQIVDGLTDIIEDNGKENNAISKKLEIIIDDQLRNGYINSYGKYVSPNEEYINLINKHTNNPSLNQQQQINQEQNKNSLNQDVEARNKIESRKYLENKFKELTGDSILKADAVLGGVDLRNSTRQDGQIEGYPYSQEALDIYSKYKDSKKSSNYLYHSTSKENLKSIMENGLTIGNKQNQEGVSAKDKLYLSASEQLAESFAPENNVIFRINPKAELQNLDNDFLGGEGSYTITNTIPVDMLQVKENGKWINLNKSQMYKDNINLPTTDKNVFLKKTINEALNNKNPKGVVLLGRVKNNVAIKIKNLLGIDIKNRIHSLSKTDIRHMIAQHGNREIESQRGQIAITEDDILKIPEIINNPDDIVKGSNNKNNQTVRYIKNYTDNTSFVVEVVPEQSGKMNIKTMWKKPTALTNSQMTPDSTSKTPDSYVSSTSNNIIPQNNQNVNNQDSTNLPQGKNVNQNNDINLPPSISANNKYKDTTTKVRKHYKSIIESQYTSDEARAIAKELMGLDTYIPETNKSELERADNRISIAGPESELNSLMSRASTGEKITPVDIAVGERLIQYYSKTGNKAKLRDAIQATAMAGTTAGQTVQAMSLLNHQTPEGQAIWLQRSVEKMNNDLKKSRGPKAEQFTLTDDMLNKIVNSESTEELHKNLDEVYKELGQQVTKSTIQKVDAWRYFSMLANPRTHIRNIVGNTAMAGMQYGIKNKVAGAVEGVVSKFNKDMERTHTIVPASKEVKAFAKADIKNVSDRLGLTDNKYNPKSRLENNMRTFKHKALENTVGKAFKFNDYMLEAEDGWGLKGGYAKSLAEYMTANKLTPSTITDAQLAKARNYAIDQAKQATFHQENQLATLINQLANKNKFAKFTVDAILPFKKTPMNIAKQGIEYSPVGLAKSMVYDSVQLRKGNITVNQYIDNVSKGLTGTGIALVGYALASMGILKASGGDDDKDKYDEARGKQTYSIEIAGKTYSLDWLAPTGIPLFIGAEIFQLKQKSNGTSTSSSDDEKKYNQAIKSAVNILDGFTNAMNPMTEMSMLSGLTSALSSYEQGSSKMLASMGTNATKSYVNQFVPTALGQIAKTTDEYERSTTSTKTGVLPKAVDTTKNQIMNKIPGLRQKLPVKTDIWGNEIKQSDNVALRAVENSIFPWTKKEVSTSNVDKKLLELYDEIGEASILPDSIDKTFTINKERYRMTNEEYNKYRNAYGETSYKMIDSLVNSKDYKNLSNEEKQKAIENIYSYAKESNKIDYAKRNNLNVEPSTLYKTLNAIEKENGNTTDYLTYTAKVSGITGENANKKKLNILTNASYSNKTKELIYANSIGKDDSLYSVMKPTKININEYLKYKQQEFTSDKQDDGTESGKSISGSKKAKVYNYVNNMKITGNQRLMLLGTQYKLTNSERQTLANYVQSLNIKNAQKKEIYSKLQEFTVYKDGRITY